MSASNELYNSEDLDFESAMRLVQRMCREEKAACRAMAAKAEPGDPVIELPASIDKLSDAANRCLLEFRRAINEACLALSRHWSESDDEDTRLIGEALESGDYSGLAI